MSRRCRYGSSCRYLANGNCWFYHPPEEEYGSFSYFGSPRRTINRTYNTSSSIFTNTYRANRLSPDYSQDTSPTSRISSIRQLMELLQLFSIREKKVEQPIKKMEKQEMKQKRKIKVNGKIIDNVNITSTLQNSKKWFFQNGNHFKHFNECAVEQCSICITKFNKDETVSMLFCNHGFHQDCLQKWLIKSDNCPLCRQNFTKHKEFQKIEGYEKHSVKKSPLLRTISSNFLFS